MMKNNIFSTNLIKIDYSRNSGIHHARRLARRFPLKVSPFKQNFRTYEALEGCETRILMAQLMKWKARLETYSQRVSFFLILSVLRLRFSQSRFPLPNLYEAEIYNRRYVARIIIPGW